MFLLLKLLDTDRDGGDKTTPPGDCELKIPF